MSLEFTFNVKKEEMDPVDYLDDVLKAVEIISSDLVKKFGENVTETVNFNRIFSSAENLMKKGMDMQTTIRTLMEEFSFEAKSFKNVNINGFANEGRYDDGSPLQVLNDPFKTFGDLTERDIDLISPLHSTGSASSDIVVLDNEQPKNGENVKLNNGETLKSQLDLQKNVIFKNNEKNIDNVQNNINESKPVIDDDISQEGARTEDLEINSVQSNINSINGEVVSDNDSSEVQVIDDSSNNDVIFDKETNDILKNIETEEDIKNRAEKEIIQQIEELDDALKKENLRREAIEIHALFPYIEYRDIYLSLEDHIFHPQRKSVVFEDYLNRAVDNGRAVSEHHFYVLREMKGHSHKRANSEIDPHGTKRFKFDLAMPSTSSQQGFEPFPSINNSQYNRDVPCQQSSEWCLEKLKQIKDMLPNVIEEQVIPRLERCMDDMDVQHLIMLIMDEGEEFLAPVANPPPEEVPPMDVAGPSVEPSNELESEEALQEFRKNLGDMFPDADPTYLEEKCQETKGDPAMFTVLVDMLMEKKDYPKMAEYLARQEKLKMRQKFIEGMSVEEFLQYFEDPEKVFMDTTKQMSKNYCASARLQLMNDLPYHFAKDIDHCLASNRNHYVPSLRALTTDRRYSGRRKCKRPNSVPANIDDDVFIKELCYVKMEGQIKAHLLKLEEDKRKSFLIAKEAGLLKECQCCYDDEVLEDDMSPCSVEVGHMFCNMCIKRFAGEQIGQGRTDMRCLQGECKVEFSLRVLQRVLAPSIFSNLLKRRQAEEIAAAGIQDLESCPFCNFATIMPNPDDKVFKCLNPECLKDSCRLCKEPNHVPLRCEEVEKKKETDARTFLENEMAEAIIRECHKCKKRFIKEEGCNKIVCACGAVSCYLCKKPVNGYEHFKENGGSGCPMWTNSLKLHADEVEKRARKAKEKLDPNVELKVDPTKDLPNVPDYLKNPPPPRPLAEPPHLQFPIYHYEPHVHDMFMHGQLAFHQPFHINPMPLPPPVPPPLPVLPPPNFQMLDFMPMGPWPLPPIIEDLRDHDRQNRRRHME